jgi:hypothetical protein
MSTNSTKPDTVQEVDLFSVSKGIGNAFRNFNTFIFRCIRFSLRNIIWIVSLFILGAALGYWLDKSDRGLYNTEIIVAPNFGSADYLYGKIDQIESSIKDRDTAALKKMGIKTPKDLVDIKITPVIDVFKFVNDSGTEHNLRLIELMAQDGDFKRVVTESTASKNYPFHLITFKTRGRTNFEKTISPLLNYLNDNDFYKKIQQEYLKNVADKLRANDTMIAQIDDVLKGVSNATGNNQSVYINENTQLNDVIKTKDELVKEQGFHRIDMVKIDKIIKDNSVIPNIKDEDGLNGKMKIVLPLLFIFIFLCVVGFRSFYRSQAAKYKSTK